MAAVGFIGLGNMGGPMAGHLLDAGHDLTVYDIDADAMEPLVEAGASAAGGPAEVAERSAYAFTSLPGPSAVEEVVLGDGGLVEGFDAGDVLVELSTVTPGLTREIEAALRDLDVGMLGAPVSRGAESAREGTLSIMVGGDPETLGACRPLIDAFAAHVIHVGERPEYGPAVKLLNNYLGFTAMVATSEAVALGRQVGLDTESMLEAFNASSGRNSATLRKFPDAIVSGTYDLASPMPIVEKDIRLFAELGGEFDVPLLHGEVIRGLLGYVRAEYGPESDQADVYRFFEKIAEGSGQRP